MTLNVTREVAAMQRLTVKQLRDRYAEVFQETTNANHRAWLIKRIAYRLQALAEGDLSERARQRAAELANDADLRLNPPKESPAVSAAAAAEESRSGGTSTHTLAFKADDRLPPPGTVLTREYKGEALQVLVREDGFEFAGEIYASLSAVAKAITGSHCNGYLFFRLGGHA